MCTCLFTYTVYLYTVKYAHNYSIHRSSVSHWTGKNSIKLWESCRVKKQCGAQFKTSHSTHLENTNTHTHLHTDARRCCLKNEFPKPSTCCTGAAFDAGTLELQSQVGCRGQGAALMLLHKRKPPIDSCHLKAAQSDWRHVRLLIMLCSCTLICRLTQSAAEGHIYPHLHTRSMAPSYLHTCAHTHTQSLWEHELPYHISWSGSKWEPVKIKGPSSISYYMIDASTAQWLLLYECVCETQGAP